MTAAQTFSLSKKEIERLYYLTKVMDEETMFHVHISHESGIGPAVKISVGNTDNSFINITDVSIW